MKQAKISELKNQLSRYLSMVKKGEVVRVLDRSAPIAEIVPLSSSSSRGAGEAALAEMERKGLIRRGTGRIDREILDKDPPGKPGGVLRALLDERSRR